MKFKTFAAVSVAVIALTLIGCSGSPTEKPVTDAKRASWVDGACSQDVPGVTLSVDFKGDVTTHCAISYAGNGWDLFGAAGFEVRGTNKYPTAFACQINQQPEAAKCDDSDTSGAYWGYYLPTNDVWGYATTGASDHESVCGSWEGWVYMETESTELKLPTPTEFACE
ncbi:MAG: hypothetical protein RLZZ56_561 [Actinomycetota bacterium]